MKILYIEDDDTFAFKLIFNEKMAKHNVLHRPDGKEGLLEFTKRPMAFDIVICDHDLPGMDGWEIVKKIREIHKNIPIIAFSALLLNNQRMLDYGANYSLTKGNKDKLYELLGEIENGDNK